MILLYNPVSSPSRKPHLPMSLLALGALLEGEHDYRIIDGNLTGSGLAEIECQLRETGADILGVTVMPGPQLQDAVPVCRKLKRRFPSLTIVWGGYFPTMHHQAVVTADYVDFAIRGHGERVFRSLVRAIRRNQVDLSQPGLAWQDADSGEARANPPASMVHPDELPDFPYHRIDMAPYIHRTFMGKRKIAHHSSYGCPFTCNFCGVVSMVSGRWLAQSAERTASVTRLLVERYDADAIEFHDNNFFVSEARTADYCQRILLLGIAWWAMGRLDLLLKFSDRTWELMRDSGLRMIYMGAESGSDATLEQMNKGGTQSAEKTLEIAARMARYGIVPEMSFVVGNPPDPEQDVHDTIRFVRRLKRINPLTEIIMYLYTPVPVAGELLTEAQTAGFRFPETLEEWTGDAWKEFSQHTSADLPWLDKSTRRKVFDFRRVLHAAYPTMSDRNLSKLGRAALKVAGTWRYRAGFYDFPLELRLLNRLFSYRRPEISGF